MSVLNRLAGHIRTAALIACGVAILGSLPGRPAAASPPRYPDILPLSKVKPGMVGYGLTTFKGTTISRFKVTVIGVMRKANAGHDLILVRMKGGPITDRGANLIHGMSGSPIYLDGKVAGAFAMGEPFPREPIGMVTPIEDMMEAWDPNIPQQPTYYLPAEKLPNTPSMGGAAAKRVSSMGQPGGKELFAVSPDSRAARPRAQFGDTIDLAHPIIVGSRRITHLVLNARPDDPRHSTGDTAVLHRATELLSVSGISERDRQWFQKELDARGYAIRVIGAPGMAAIGGQSTGFKGAPLKPGSAFGTWLTTGDVLVGGTGTVTYRRGNRILGFGHPLMGLGALNAAVSAAWVLDIFPGLDTSHHIAEPGPVVGTLRQDRDFSVSAELGTLPSMIPFDVTVHDHTTLRTQTFHTRVFQHPDITPLLLRMVAKDVVGQVHNIPGDTMARVTTTLDAAEVGEVTRTNVVFDAQDIATTITSDLGDITNVVSGNPFYPLPIKSAHMTVDLSSGHDTATVERIFLKQGKYEPGDTLDVGVVLKPYRRAELVRNISLKVPSDTPSGRYALIVRGGAAQMMRIGGFVISGGVPDAQAPPVNVRQMIDRLHTHEQNTDIVARLVLNTAAPSLEGEKLTQLPPNLAMLMRSDRNSGVRLERDELRTVMPDDYVISGFQQLVVTIQRKNTQEPGGVNNFGGGPPAMAPGGRSPFEGAGQGNLTGASANEEESQPGAPPKGALPELPVIWSGSAHRRIISEDGQSGDRGSIAGNPPAANVDADENKSDPTDTDDDGASQEGQQPSPPVASGKPARGAQQMKRTSAADKQNDPDADAGDDGTAAPSGPNGQSAPDSPPDRPVGRQAQVWRQVGGTEFGAGKFSGAAVSASGELGLAPRLRRLATSGETYIWSIVSDAQGNLYAGTGTSGKILKVDRQGSVSTFAALPVLSVQTLLMGRDGNLWAGSGLKGSLYRLTPNGAYTLVAALPEKYILALAEDSKGNLFIGPGGGGTVYRLRTDAVRTALVKPDAYLKTSADHVMALCVDAHDNLYVGTGNDGILYKVTSDGKSSVLYDAKENAITALASDSAGNVYAGTGPKGLLYRIGQDGVATVIYDRATSFYTAVRAAPDGTFYASTVNAVYHIHPGANRATATVVHPLDNPKDVDFLTLAVLPDGGVVAGTGNVGEIYSSGSALTSATTGNTPPVNVGTYESVVHDAHIVSRWGAFRVVALFNAATGTAPIQAATRSGNVAEPDSTWSDWTPVPLRGAAEMSGTVASAPARFLQYRLTLTGGAPQAHPVASTPYDDERPTVHSVSVSYMTRNQPPRVVFQSPQGDERWSKTQTIRWNGADPDNDTLTYDLYISTDGVNWKPLPGKPIAHAPGSGPADSARNQDTIATVADPLKRMIAANSGAQAGPLGIAAGSIGSLRVTSRSWDTSVVADGIYRLKVVVTDRVSNPVDAQTAEAISEPFTVCNTPPTITVSSQPIIGSDRRVTFTGSATQMLVAITAVQYRVDGGDWIAAVPKDGLFDGPQEGFTVSTLPLVSGKHSIEVAAFSASSVRAVQKVDVLIP